MSPVNTWVPPVSLIATVWGTPSSRLRNASMNGPDGATSVFGSKSMLRAVRSRGPLPAGGAVTAPGTGVGPLATDASTAGGLDAWGSAVVAGEEVPQPASTNADRRRHAMAARRSMTPLFTSRSRNAMRGMMASRRVRGMAGAHGSRTHRATPGAAPPVLKTGEPTGTPPLPRNGDRSPYVGRHMIGR